MNDIDFLISCAEHVGVTLSHDQAAALIKYRDLVLEANAKFNLTAITDGEEFAVKHIADSLVGASEITSGAKVCDIGAGAGFPSIPLAVVRDDIRMTSLDATAKKINFVSAAARDIGLTNVRTVAGRVEEQRALFGTFDVVTARAVAALPILLELCMPLLKVGGHFLAYKADDGELSLCDNACKVLGAKYVHSKYATLPNGDKRAILVFEKISATPKQYPRQYGTIKKKPL